MRHLFADTAAPIADLPSGPELAVSPGTGSGRHTTSEPIENTAPQDSAVSRRWMWVNCPTCGAAMRLEAEKECLVCDFCGNIHYPEPNAEGIRVLDEPSKLSCPVCSVPLVQAAAGGERILYCNHCHGTLISMDVFMAIVQDMRSRRETAAGSLHPINWKDLDRRIKCPQCGRQMETHPYGGGGNVIIDDCESCSLNWLDYGELDRIVRAWYRPPGHTCPG